MGAFDVAVEALRRWRDPTNGELMVIFGAGASYDSDPSNPPHPR
jgi:hypothetical protein